MDNSIFRKMNQIEIEIKQITDIRMIHIYELTGAAVNENKYGCTAMAVYYGDNKQINLSELDPYFDMLVNKVMQLYASMDDKSHIMMDENTTSIMESGEVFIHAHSFDQYIDKTPLKFQELSIDSTLSKRFAPLVEYLVVGLYKIFELDLKINSRTYGWRGATIMSGFLREKPVSLYFKLEKNDYSHYTISVVNFIKEYGNLEIKLSINYNGLEIRYNSKELQLYGETSFCFDVEKIRETHVAYFKDKQVFYDINDYANEYSEEMCNELLNEIKYKSILNGTKGIKAIYELPFDMIYVIKEEINNSDRTNASSYCGTFIWTKALLADSRGWIQVQNLKSKITVRTDSYFTISTRLRGDKTQIYFVPDYGNATGQYKQKLEGKYFLTE